MKITEHKSPFPYITLEEIFDKEEWMQITFELEWLKLGGVFGDERHSGTAMDTRTGERLSSKTGLFLETFYAESRLSPTATNVDKKFIEIINKANSWYFDFPNFTDLNICPLVSYYEESGYYHPHVDESIYTFIFWYHSEPKQFSGGELIFPEYDIKLDPIPNSGILFPGPISHSVNKITNCSEDAGRFSVSTFITAPKFPENQ
jgi:hypothetical protein